MNDDEHPHETALSRQLRAGFARLGGSGAAAVIALALGLTGVFGTAPARTAAMQAGTVQAAAFTLSSDTNGTISLTLSQMFDPAALQRALARHGTRALVKIGSYCSSTPAAPSPIRLGVLPGASPRPAGTRRRATPGLGNGQGIWETLTLPVKPSQLAPMVDPVSMVINPAAMPAGTELFIGYFDLAQTIVVNLIYTSSHTCRNTQQPPG